MAHLTIAEVQQKTTKGGKPYLNVKSSTGKYYTCWQEQQYIWHLLIPGATIEPVIATNGAFSSITGIMGVVDESGGVTIATNRENAPQVNSGAKNGNLPNVYEWITEKLKEMDKKLDFLVEERKTLGELPKLPEGDINVEKLPF